MSIIVPIVSSHSALRQPMVVDWILNLDVYIAGKLRLEAVLPILVGPEDFLTRKAKPFLN